MQKGCTGIAITLTGLTGVLENSGLLCLSRCPLTRQPDRQRRVDECTERVCGRRRRCRVAG